LLYIAKNPFSRFLRHKGLTASLFWSGEARENKKIIIIFRVLFIANRFALTKPVRMGWRNVGIRLKILPVEQINIC